MSGGGRAVGFIAWLPFCPGCSLLCYILPALKKALPAGEQRRSRGLKQGLVLLLASPFLAPGNFAFAPSSFCKWVCGCRRSCAWSIRADLLCLEYSCRPLVLGVFVQTSCAWSIRADLLCLEYSCRPRVLACIHRETSSIALCSVFLSCALRQRVQSKHCLPDCCVLDANTFVLFSNFGCGGNS